MVTAASTPPQRKREGTDIDRSQDVSCYSFWTGFLIGVLVSIVLLDVVSRAPFGEPRVFIADTASHYISTASNSHIVAPDLASVSNTKDDSSSCDKSLGMMTAEAARANVDISVDNPRVTFAAGDREFEAILQQIRTASASGSRYINYAYDVDDCTAMRDDVKCTPHTRGQMARLYVDMLKSLGFKVLFGKIMNTHFMGIEW